MLYNRIDSAGLAVDAAPEYTLASQTQHRKTQAAPAPNLLMEEPASHSQGGTK